MANKNGFKVQIEVDPKTLNYFEREAPNQLQKARKNVVEACGMVWADESKDITTNENHIVTGLYVNSIGYNTGSPATQADVIHELKEGPDTSTLRTGSAVKYAASLEKKYAIMARALDLSEDRMNNVALTQVKKALSL